jgi:type IV pilus assembly protein PilM
MKRAGKTLVGLDIEPGYVAAVESKAGSLAIQKAAVATLPPGVVRDGEVADPEALAGVLKALFAEHKLGTKVRIGLANQQIVMRTIDLPPLTDQKQLASAIRFQAQEHIAMPLEQAVLEHQSLGLVGTPDGPRSRVVLVAARREMVTRLLAAARRAGLRPEGVDLSAFAMIRALYDTDDGDDLTAYINVGGTTNLAVAANTICQFTRVIPNGSELMVTELAERRALTREHALGWLRHVGLSAPIAEIEGQPDIVQAARTVLTDGVARIADEVLTTLGFYATQAGGATVHRVLLTGPAVSIPGFPERFGDELRMPVEVRVVGEAQPGSLDGLEAGQLTVAAGLTMSEAIS